MSSTILTHILNLVEKTFQNHTQTKSLIITQRTITYNHQLASCARRRLWISVIHDRWLFHLSCVSPHFQPAWKMFSNIIWFRASSQLEQRNRIFTCLTTRDSLGSSQKRFNPSLIVFELYRTLDWTPFDSRDVCKLEEGDDSHSSFIFHISTNKTTLCVVPPPHGTYRFKLSGQLWIILSSSPHSFVARLLVGWEKGKGVVEWRADTYFHLHFVRRRAKTCRSEDRAEIYYFWWSETR